MTDARDDMPDGEADQAPYQSLYRRFRPSTFTEVKGQDHVVLALRNAVRDGHVAHAYLFSGPRGTGKTSTARILAKALNCTDLHDGEPCGVCSSCTEIAKGTSLDVHELDAASNNGVDAMRDLVSRAALGTPGRQKVYIVDEVHMLSTQASNALLKTLEEPPAHVIFVLATTDPQKVLPTIRSRTQHFEFRLLGADTLSQLLEQVRHDAHLSVPDGALDIAVRRGRGSARDALSVLDQVAASDHVEDDLPQLDAIIEALADRDVGRALVAVGHLTSSGFSPQQLTGDLVELLRQGFLALVAPSLVSVVGIERDTIGELAQRLGLPALVRSLEVLGRSQVGMRDAPDPRVNLEVALVRLAHPEADMSPEAMLVRIERLERAGMAAPVAAAPSPSVSAAPSPPAPPAPVPAAQPAVARAAADTPAAGIRKTLGAVRRQSAESSAASGVAAPLAPAAPDTDAGVAHTDVVNPVNASSDPSALPLPTREQLVQVWDDHILGRLRPKAKALFLAGHFVSTDDGKAVFGLPNETHRQRCEAIRSDVEPSLSEYFGRPITLSLVVDGSPQLHVDPTPAPAVTTTAGAHPMDDDPKDLSDFDEGQLGEVVTDDHSAQTRVLRAFPGAEEVR